MIEAALLIFFPMLMAYAACSDLITMTIANRISALLIVGFVVIAFAVGMSLEAIAWHFAAAGVALALTFALFALNVMGGGDAKLIPATVLWMGGALSLEYAVAFAVLGGVMGLGLLFARTLPLPLWAAQTRWIAHLHHEKTGVPYGIALAGAALILYPQTDLFLAGARTILIS